MDKLSVIVENGRVIVEDAGWKVVEGFTIVLAKLRGHSVEFTGCDTV